MRNRLAIITLVIIAVTCASVAYSKKETTKPTPLIIETQKEVKGIVTVVDIDETIKAQYAGVLNVKGNSVTVKIADPIANVELNAKIPVVLPDGSQIDAYLEMADGYLYVRKVE